MTSRTNRQLVLDIRQTLAELSTLSEAKAAGVMALGGSSTKKGHVQLWRGEEGPKSLHEVFVRRFREAAGDHTRLEETLVSARVALRNARARQPRQVIDAPDWRLVFIQNAAGSHYVEAAADWEISPSYARKLRRLAGKKELDGLDKPA